MVSDAEIDAGEVVFTASVPDPSIVGEAAWGAATCEATAGDVTATVEETFPLVDPIEGAEGAAAGSGAEEMFDPAGVGSWGEGSSPTGTEGESLVGLLRLREVPPTGLELMEMESPDASEEFATGRAGPDDGRPAPLGVQPSEPTTTISTTAQLTVLPAALLPIPVARMSSFLVQ